MPKMILFAVAIVTITFLLFRTSDEPTVTELEAVPRAQLYARLDPLFAAIEAKARTTQTVTGTPSVPVQFSFERKDQSMLGLSAQGGMRKVSIRLWLEDGERPGETLLKAQFEPEAIFTVEEDKNVLRALESILGKIDDQFIEGQRITALFGGHAKPRE
jgi:hypothetical protein